MPVSLNVSHHSFDAVQHLAFMKCQFLETLAHLGKASSGTTAPARFSHLPGMRSPHLSQMLVGASRQRAAPRNQFCGHCAGAPCKCRHHRSVLGNHVLRPYWLDLGIAPEAKCSSRNGIRYPTSTPPRTIVALVKAGASNDGKS